MARSGSNAPPSESTTEQLSLFERFLSLHDGDAKRTPTNGDPFKVARADGTTITSRGKWGEWLRATAIEHASKYNTRE